MKKSYQIILWVLFWGLILAGASCSVRSVKSRAMEVARSTVNYGIPQSEQFTVTGVAIPDSVMGDRFIDDDELQVIFGLLHDVSGRIIKRTNNLNRVDSTDTYLIGLANLQIEANNNMNTMMCQPTFTDTFTGWKVRVFYERAIGPDTLRVMRYCFLTPDGNAVIRTLDFPML